MSPHFFETAADWRQWLEKHHSNKTELLVGFYKRASGRRSMTWPESVDEALCFGWIDGVRRMIDEISYSIRFSIRRRGSIWSNVNINKVESLIADRKMTAAGLEKFKDRAAAKSGIYSYEQKSVDFDDLVKKQFMLNKEAWAFFQTQPPSYQKKIIWWVMKARLPATRQKRLATLITNSMKQKRL